jgi:hypothetical protein
MAMLLSFPQLLLPPAVLLLVAQAGELFSPPGATNVASFLMAAAANGNKDVAMMQ